MASVDPSAVSLSDNEKPVDVEQTAVQPSDRKSFKRPIKGWKWFSICLGLYLAAILYGLDTTIAADVQGPILESLGEIEKFTWVGVGFPMASVATILVWGVMYGLFEIKYLTLSSLFIFEVGSAICATAPTMNAMIVGRVIAGLGGAGMYLGALNYISVFTTLKERPIYMALIGLSWGTGCILGPVVGGAFAVSNATWRWAFYINLVLYAVTAPIYFFLFPRYQPRPNLMFRAKLFAIDWVGAFLVATCFVLFLVNLSLSGTTYHWNSGAVIGLWVVFGLALLSLIIQQGVPLFTTVEHRIYPVQFLRRRSMVLLYIATACSATGLAVPTYYIPIFFQFTKNDSAIMAAVRLLPFITVNIAFTMISGGLLPVFGYYMPMYLASGILILIGGALSFTVNAATSASTIYGYTVLVAVGAGFAGQIAYSIVAVKVKPHELPAAIGFINIAQIGSIAIGLGVAGSVFQNTGYSNLQSALAAFNYSETDLRGALAGVQSVILSSAPDNVRQLALDAIVLTISRMYALLIAAGALSLIGSIFMKREKLQLEMAAVS